MTDELNFEGHAPNSKQPFYNCIFNNGTMPKDICVLPDAVYDELTRRVEVVLDHLMAKNIVLFAACDEAHQLLYHYDLARQPNGVNWGPVELLRAEFIDKLWTAIITAEPALDIKSEPRPC